MADENEFVQTVRFQVDDGDLSAALGRFQDSMGKTGDDATRLSKETSNVGKEAERAAKETHKIADATRDAQKETHKLEGSFSKLKGVIAGAVAAYAGFQGISKLIGFGKESVEAFKLQDQAERSLKFQMQRNGNADRFGELQKFASRIQENSMYGDEGLLSAASTWTNRIKDVDNSKRMMQMVADYAARSTNGGEANADQLKSYAQTLLGAITTGRTMTLEQQGFDTSAIKQLQKIKQDGGIVTEDMQVAALEKTLESIRGFAKEMANTDAGKITQLQNEIGDVKEEVGRELLPVLADLAYEIKSNMPSIRSLLHSFGNVLKSLIGTLSQNVGAIASFANGVSTLLNIFAQAPVSTMAFVGAMKFVIPMMDSAQKGSIAFGKSLNGLGMSWQGFLKAGLFTATVWGLQKIWEAGNLLVDLANEKLREARREEAAGEIERATKERGSWQRSMKDYEKFMTPEEKELMKKMPSIPWNPGWDKAAGAGFDMRSLPNGATENLINWARAKGAYDYYQGLIGQGQAKMNRNHSLPWKNSSGNGPDVDFKPEDFTYTPVDLDAEMQKAMQSVAKTAKGSTNITNIDYTNNIKTDSDMMARLIKDNLRTLLQSQLTFVNRSEAVKALAL